MKRTTSHSSQQLKIRTETLRVLSDNILTQAIGGGSENGGCGSGQGYSCGGNTIISR